ncbi:class A beta-lactamase [Pseudomarimonas salicorniae]|uniref:Beta-lactamase n=1 Tax=Pseudomarimonas salicorniae TaxID=2933270 RepID=A0ABT0GG30_9GAMM|nr:class A beta-lactamase [Lysobacter sp. CAU 1642]
MHQPHRRHLLAFLATSALYAALPLPTARAAGTATTSLGEALSALERAHGGRLGVQVVGLDGIPQAGHRADERFALCSTFKLLLAAVVLREAQHGRIDLNRPIRFGKADLVPYAPVVEKHLDAGALSLRELAHATQTTSDNVAANLLLRELGGPEGFTEKLRELGDTITRIDRIEPQMNLVPSGEVRDTTTPRAMAETVHRLFTTDLLDEASKATLKSWMIETRTGLRRLRAGLPADWEVGDKTGTGVASGMANKHNDVAVVWRPGLPPLVIAAYWEADGYYPKTRPQDEAVLAEVGRLVASAG